MACIHMNELNAFLNELYAHNEKQKGQLIIYTPLFVSSCVPIEMHVLDDQEYYEFFMFVVRCFNTYSKLLRNLGTPYILVCF